MNTWLKIGIRFLTTDVFLPLGSGGSRNRDKMARNWVKWVNIRWTSALPTFSHPSVQVSLGIDIVVLRVTSKRTNSTTILFTILCSVSPRYPCWQLFGNDQFLSHGETRRTESGMLCAFATWQIVSETSQIFKLFWMSILLKKFNMLNFLNTDVSSPLGLGGPRNRDQMARSWVKWVNIMWTSTLTTFSHPSVQVSLGIHIAALRVTSEHTNATTIFSSFSALFRHDTRDDNYLAMTEFCHNVRRGFQNGECCVRSQSGGYLVKLSKFLNRFEWTPG